MRSRLRWPVLLAAAALLLAACSQGSDAPSTAARPPAATTGCASNGELAMWERSGGNKQMVDMLVAAWNQKNPNCKVKLTYIPHTEMVGKIAQGIASGEVVPTAEVDWRITSSRASREAFADAVKSPYYHATLG